LANHGDQKTLEQLANPSTEHIGQSGKVAYDADDEKNLFFFELQNKL
jgi:hypothetical protein